MPEQYEVHSPATKRSVASELSQLESDCTRSAEAQTGAAARWRHCHYLIGITAVAMSVLSSVAFAGNHPVLAATLSSLLAVFVAVMTFMKPSARACEHKTAGDQYRALCNEVRIFREIQLFHACDDQSAIAGLNAFVKRRSELDTASRRVCGHLFRCICRRIHHRGKQKAHGSDEGGCGCGGACGCGEKTPQNGGENAESV
ncbi:MAG: SLATT domain-containing protein [Azoarcus sp.]|jgi:hypothetical protein|nr:SLATT domain-containing protein [Azoarcus sp.]